MTGSARRDAALASLPLADPAARHIPRLIHQTYPGALPDALRQNLETLRSRNPGWQHHLYDDADMERFILDHFGPDLLSYFLRIAPEYGAARADFFRYLAVYRLGGVYLDIKSRFTRPLDEVIGGDEGFIVSKWANATGEVHEGYGLHPELAAIPGGEIQQWHVIAAPGHPFLRAVIESIIERIDRYRPWRGGGVGKVGVLRLTGPIAYTLAITPLLDRYPHKVVPDERALGLEYSIVAGDGHQAMFAKHYSQSTAPVVTLTGRNRLLNLGYSVAKPWLQRLKLLPA